MFEVTPPPAPRPLVLPNQPLVTDPAPVINSNTAKDFIDAIRSGFITSQDIADRVGTLGQSQRAAEIQKNREVVDPAFINARKEQALLAGETAAAQRPLVSEKTSLEMDTLRAKTAETVYGDSIQAYKRYHPPLFRPDGKPANEEMAEMGSHYKRAELLKARAEVGLTPTNPNGVTFYKDGVERRVLLNANDEDITPPMDGSVNPARKKYLQMREEADWMIADPSPVLKRQKELKDQWFPKTGKGQVAAAAQKPASKPVVEPGGTVRESTLPEPPPAAKAYVPGTGIPISKGAEPTQADTEKQVLSYVDDVRKTPQYQAWSEKMSAINALDEIEKAYATNPEITNVLDSALAGVTLQLLSPGASANARSFQDFKVANIEEHAQTLREKIVDLPEKLLGKDRFEPGARARILTEARRLVTAKENAAATVLQRAAKFAEAKQADPFFDEKEKAILVRASQPPPPTGAPGAKPGTTETAPGTYRLPSGKTITFTRKAAAPAPAPAAATAPVVLPKLNPANEQEVARGLVDIWRQSKLPVINPAQ